MPLVAGVAALSLVVGNVAAIAQSSVRRLLAYSAVAHAGYMLLGLLAGMPHGLASLLYYVITYGLTTVGAFGVVAVVQARTGDDRLPAFAGLARRSPLLAVCMLVFLLSLAGIPPLAGFFGKFYLFAGAMRAEENLGLLWLVALAIAMSAVSLYYYLQVLKQIYVAPGPGDPAVGDPARATCAVVVVLAAAVIVLGCAPRLLLDPILSALNR
jgi:NADH-quinone oxidoreductase subunit N